jgi:hypothetical protein
MQKFKQYHLMWWSIEDHYRCTMYSSKAFSLLSKKIEQVKWMAMWQEQESGVRNFSIIELAKDW